MFGNPGGHGPPAPPPMIVLDKTVRTKDCKNKGLMPEQRENVDKFFLSA